MNPLELRGPEFLAFYTFTLIVAWVCAKGLAKLLTPAGNEVEGARTDPYDLAYLAGGAKGLAQASLAALCRIGLIAQGTKPGTIVRSGNPAPRLHAAGAAALPGDDAPNFEKTLYSQGNVAMSIHARLVDQGLLVSDAQRSLLAMLGASPMLAAILLGVVKVLIGLQRNRPVILLVIMLVAAFIALIFLLRATPLRTRAGEQRLDDYRLRHHALALTCSRSPEMLRSYEVALAVGLFGDGMLCHQSMTWLASAVNYREPSATGSSSCSTSGSSCGSSGCGGGGCGGGCGGCGS